MKSPGPFKELENFTMPPYMGSGYRKESHALAKINLYITYTDQ